jgi:gamma-glutamylaminecyclotransferase
VHPVLVYGTLKRGFPNHDGELLARFYVGLARTVEAYPLCVAGRWYSPVMFPEPGIGERVTGELYAVDRDTLDHLDRLERVGEAAGYRRRRIAVECDHADIGEAWCYMKDRALATPLHSGYLADYQDRRYVPRHLR